MQSKSILAVAGASVLGLLIAAAPLAAAALGTDAMLLGAANRLPIQLVQGRDPAPSGPANVNPRGPGGPRTISPRGPTGPRIMQRNVQRRFIQPRTTQRRFVGPGQRNLIVPRGNIQRRFVGPRSTQRLGRIARIRPGFWHPGRRFWAYPFLGAGLSALVLAPGWYWGDYYDECMRYIVPCPDCAPVLVDLCEQQY